MTQPLAFRDYPLLNLFLTMLWLFLWILWIFLLIRIVMDIFRSDDLSGWAKALWTIFIIVLPLIGVLVYLIARGADMQRREIRDARASEQAFRGYVQRRAGTSPSTAEELSKLAALRGPGRADRERMRRAEDQTAPSTSLLSRDVAQRQRA